MIVVFSKTQEVNQIAHLDLMRAMQRSLRRSNLPVSYSNGFNPHMHLAFSPPLSVGITGENEMMDVPISNQISESDFISILNSALPTALLAKKCYVVDDKLKSLMALTHKAQYKISMDSLTYNTISSGITDFLNQKEIITLKKSKKGEKMVDIRPLIDEIKCNDNEHSLLCVISASSTASLHINLLIKELLNYSNIALNGSSYIFASRTKLLTVQNDECMDLEEYIKNYNNSEEKEF